MSEVTERESLIKYRNASCWVKSHRADDAEKSITGACLLVMYPPVYKGHDTHLGFFYGTWENHTWRDVWKRIHGVR
jgi:hypothetical protein